MTLEGPGAGAPSDAGEVTASFTPTSGAQASPGSAPLPEIGQPFGDYQIVRRLGRGGMGVVYEAEHLPTGRRVALKVLSRAFDSPEARRRFLREGRLAASVSHPNSVYIFSTEEIEGSPVIAMELVLGGTLQQRVKEQGPLPVAEAVDVTLQVIAGLEAAQAVGVLHRDVKPANCFIDSDGRVKIGDFGLSISTTGRDESFLTAVRSVLGTPAFSSPEQLRGDELNVRSDIYSVGVTLYYLLTGQTPFAADNLVKLLATVLDQPAASPERWRPEIPAQLARAVLRCLEKQPEKRFGSYEELRQALFAFSSIAPTPAGLPLRFLAGLVDSWVATALVSLSAVGTGSLAYLARESSLEAVVHWLLFAICELAYFALSEGIWGASPGKAICGLRVIGPDRNIPGMRRAMVRAAIYILAPTVPVLVQVLLFPADLPQASNALPNLTPAVWTSSVIGVVIWGLLFATMRRRNGMATVYDLISHSRVIVRPKHVARPGLAPSAEPALSTEGAVQVGPYHVLEHLPAPEGETILLGYDARLLRKVWIRELPAGSPPVSAELRNLARPGRLRWLSGSRSSESSWDAYEAPSGRPLLSLLQSPQPWQAVRGWLFDVVEELNAGLREHALPEVLSLDRVWITADGRAKLLDFAAPGSQGQAAGLSPPTGKEFEAARGFLCQVALSALEARVVDAEQALERGVEAPLPLHARRFLQELPSLPGPELPTDKLREILHRSATISRRRRLATFACPLVFALFAIAFTGYLAFRDWRCDRQWSAGHPDLPSLRVALEALGWSRSRSRRDENALQIYVVGHYHEIITDKHCWERPDVAGGFRSPMDLKRIAQRALAAHPNPSADELRNAHPVATSAIAAFQRWRRLLWIDMAALSPVVAWTYCAAFGLLTTLVFRRGIQMFLLDVVIVNRRGATASRLRTLWRYAACVAPLLAAMAGYFLMGSYAHSLDDLGAVRFVCLRGMIVALLALFPLGAVWSVWSPERGLQDRLAGTWLVRR